MKSVIVERGYHPPKPDKPLTHPPKCLMAITPPDVCRNCGMAREGSAKLEKDEGE